MVVTLKLGQLSRLRLKVAALRLVKNCLLNYNRRHLLQMPLSAEGEWVLPVPFLFFMYLRRLNFLLWVEEIKKPRKVKSSKVLLAKPSGSSEARLKKQPLLRRKRKEVEWLDGYGARRSIFHPPLSSIIYWIRSCNRLGLPCQNSTISGLTR